MIRSRAEAKEKAFKLLELTMVCLLFGFPLWLSLQPSVLSGAWRWISPAVGFLLAIVLPTFVTGTPEYRLNWTINGRSARDVETIEAASLPVVEGVTALPFSVGAMISIDSAWAYRTHRRNLRLGAAVFVELLPPMALDVKLETPTAGGAKMTYEAETSPGSDLIRQFIELPLTSVSTTAQQSVASGYLMLRNVTVGTEDVTTSGSLRVRKKLKEGSDHDVIGTAPFFKTSQIGSERLGLKTIVIRR